MEIVKNKRTEDDFLDLILSNLKPSSNSLSRLSEANRESLKDLINYLSKLKKQSTIDEKQFSELVTLACANFIENEVEFRVSNTLSNKIMVLFEKL